jgi:hypothetical protein
MFRIKTTHCRNNGNTERLVCQIYVHPLKGDTRLDYLGWVKRCSIRRGQYRKFIKGQEKNIICSVEGMSNFNVSINENMYISLDLTKLIKYWKQGLDIRSPWLQSIFLELTPRVYKLKSLSSDTDKINSLEQNTFKTKHGAGNNQKRKYKRITILVLESEISNNKTKSGQVA